MAEAIPIQRVTLYLKNGTNLFIDLKAEDPQKVNPQINAFQKALADPESQEKVFLFQGMRGLWVRIKEVVAFDAVSLILSPVEKEKAKAE
ncbi:hypothetical protein [Parasutterella excrementihominis]|uniref:hypothetical protein n=1 Tax=Parasutterella excrementihominis TaxID=487175 RepID=UPI00356639CC